MDGYGDRALQARALAAIAVAAKVVGVEPSALSMLAYRDVRAEHHREELPSPLAISLLFGGWERARERAACGELATYTDGGFGVDGRALRSLR